MKILLMKRVAQQNNEISYVTVNNDVYSTSRVGNAHMACMCL